MTFNLCRSFLFTIWTYHIAVFNLKFKNDCLQPYIQQKCQVKVSIEVITIVEFTAWWLDWVIPIFWYLPINSIIGTNWILVWMEACTSAGGQEEQENQHTTCYFFTWFSNQLPNIFLIRIRLWVDASLKRIRLEISCNYSPYSAYK